MNLTVKVTKVVVLKTSGADAVYIMFDGPTSFPKMQEMHPTEDYSPSLKVEVQNDFALEWLNQLGITPDLVDVINTVRTNGTTWKVRSSHSIVDTVAMPQHPRGYLGDVCYGT